MTRMADDVPSTQRVILEGIEQGVTSILQIVISAAMMFIANWKLALVVVVPTPFIAAGGYIFSRWVQPRARDEREASSRLNSLLHDTVTGVRQIKSYTAEESKQRDFERMSGLLRTAKVRLMAAWSIYHPLMTFLGDIGLVTLLAVGAYGCITGFTTPGELLQFIMLIGLFFEPVSRLHGVNQTMVGGLVSAKRVFDIIDHEGEEDLENGCALESVRGDIEFRGATFGYDPQRPVVRGLNLRVHPHQTVAIVGATGSGKSTLFQLLTRFYDVQGGEVLLDGVPVQEYSRHSLRGAIGYVTQDAFLFAGTVRDNLLLGKPDTTDEELWAALGHACAEDFVRRLEHGLEEEVGERGVKLSGGERQRLAMARAFLKNAPILLLDEATSAVDNKSEHLIQAALSKLRSNRTSLIIAHRLSTVIEADQIYVMRLGEVLAHGRHAELLATCPYYAELAALAFETSKAA
jgi:ATP-binding cassette subfamily B protein/subfamily B ATP-binding cassette protein MsbA